MNNQRRAVALTLILVLGSGCATTAGTNQATGAALGAVAGGLICALAGGNAGTCVAAAAGGAALGWGAVKLKQVVNQREELAEHTARPMVMIRDYRLDPMQVQPGQSLTALTSFDLSTPATASSRPVTQNFKLLKDGEEVLAFTAMDQQLTEHGRYHVGFEVPIPRKAEPGNYELVQVLDAQTAAPEVRTAVFQVVKRLAGAGSQPADRG